MKLFEVRPLPDGWWVWQLRAANGAVLATSAPYCAREIAVEAARMHRETTEAAPIAVYAAVSA